MSSTSVQTCMPLHQPIMLIISASRGARKHFRLTCCSTINPVPTSLVQHCMQIYRTLNEGNLTEQVCPFFLPQEAEGQQAGEPEQNVSMKLCRRCNTHKPVTQFYKSKANADGYDGRCKACDAIQCATRRKRKERVEASSLSSESKRFFLSK